MKYIFCLVLCVSVCATTSGQVDFDGTQIQLHVVADNAPPCADSSTDQGTRTVGPGVEYAGLVDGAGINVIDVFIDIDSSTITFDYSLAGSGMFCAGVLNSYLFTDPADSIPPITHVSIDTAETTLGVNSLDLTFDENSISLNVEGLSFSPDSFVKLDVAFVPPCPADTNNDGSLSPADFTAWIAAFNANAPECDQNGDGSCTPADFTAWIANFNAGC